MQEEELFIPQSILQSEDFDTIKSAVFKKFKNSPAGVQSWAAQRLHTYRQNGIYWGPIVTKMLIFLATAKDGQIKQGDLTQATSSWLCRISDLGMSNRSLPKYADLSVDCLYFLYKMKIITPTQVCCLDPLLWARFASLFSVHDFMNIKHDGHSPVYTYLEQRKNTTKVPEALSGLEKLFELYKSDFKYIISPDLAELRLIVEEFSTHGTVILKFLKNTELAFPAIDNANASLYEAIIMSYWRYPIKKPAKLTGMQKFLRRYSEKKFGQMETTNNANPKIARKIMPELQWYLVQAYESANKPNETFSLPDGFTSTSQFPLQMLPMEVIESILSESHTDELVRSIFCLSKGCSHLKRSFDWRRFLKKQFPLKYHVVNETLAENPKFKWNHYSMVQNRFRSNWSAAKFSKFTIPGAPCKMDDNVLVGCSNKPHIDDENIESDEVLFFSPNDHEGSFELTNDHVGYYWINWNDTKDYYKVNFFAPVSDAKVCLVDSVAEVPKIALVFGHYVEIWEGSQMIAEAQTPILNEYIRNPYYHNSSLFIGPYEYRLDNNMARRQVLFGNEYVMDISRTNNLMITMTHGSKLTIKSQTDYQTIASISSPYMEHTSAVFLDDNLFAAYWEGKIQLFDVRNMDAAVSQIDLSSCKHRLGALDGPNQRATSESDAGSIVHIWNLKTCKWTTAFETENYGKDYLINARYLCAGAVGDTTIVFDFTNNTKEY